MDRDRWNKRYADEAFVWTAAANQFVVAETARLEPGRALDLGTGEGRNAVWLAARGWQVTAVDFSNVGLQKARRLAKAHGVKVDWVLADLTQYPLKRAYYDLVLMCYLQLPASTRRQILAGGRAACRPGGTFLYVGHDLSNLECGHGGPKDPAVLCTPQEIVADLPGFEIVRAEVVQRPVAPEPAHGGPPDAIALDALVRAVRQRRGHAREG
ncbi:MAG: class I SAM-dependent methyltransferase [Acidiferrobacterales bacterium]